MNGYLANLVDRSALGQENAPKAPILRPVRQTADLEWNEVSEPITESDQPIDPVVQINSGWPSSKDRAAKEIPAANQPLEPSTKYFERHFIRTHEIRNIHQHHEAVTPGERAEMSSDVFQWPRNDAEEGSIIVPATVLPTKVSQTNEYRPAEHLKRDDVTKPQASVENSPRELHPVQKRIETQLPMMKPSKVASSPNKTEVSSRTPKLVIGKLVVEVIEPKPQIQTVAKPVQSAPSSTPSPPPMRYNKLTFGLGQL